VWRPTITLAVRHRAQPIMLGDAALANRMAAAMLERGVYVVGFSYPVVPKGAARIRVQLSAGARVRVHVHVCVCVHGAACCAAQPGLATPALPGRRGGAT
jgi:glycine C-acetyltransferase